MSGRRWLGRALPPSPAAAMGVTEFIICASTEAARASLPSSSRKWSSPPPVRPRSPFLFSPLDAPPSPCVAVAHPWFCPCLRNTICNNQLYSVRAILQYKRGVQFHSCAKEVASSNLFLPRGHATSKNIILDVENKFEKALGKLQKEKISVYPNDPAAESQFAKVMVTTRENQFATSSETLLYHKDFKVKYSALQHKMQECARLGDLSGALDHLDLMRPLTILDYNSLLYNYIKSGHASVEHLMVLYDMLGRSGLHPNFRTFNIISNGLCSLGHVENALWFIQEMCQQGYIPSCHSLSRLMEKSLRLQALEVSLSLLNLMLIYDYFPTLPVLYSLISSLSRVGRIARAYYIFLLLLDNDICPRVYSYNPILFALCKSGEILVALSIFCFVGKKGCLHNVYSYTALVFGFCKKRLWSDAYSILEQMQNSGCEPNAVTYTIVIKSLCDDGRVMEALCILGMMTKRGGDADLVTYNVMIRALCSHNMISEVCELMQVASKKSLSPDGFSVSALAGGILKAGKVSHALECLRNAFSGGFAGDVVTWNIYFHCLCCDNKSKEALFLLKNKMGEGFVPSVVTYNTILKGYCKEQNIDEALQLFDHFEWPKGGPDSISFNTLLSAACKQRRSLLIQRTLKNMDLAGIKIDVTSIACLVQYFCKVHKLSDCRGVLDYICSTESVNKASYNVLLQTLCKEESELDKISRRFVVQESRGS